jgi:hypothetical protein
MARLKILAFARAVIFASRELAESRRVHEIAVIGNSANSVTFARMRSRWLSSDVARAVEFMARAFDGFTKEPGELSQLGE